MSLSWRDRLQVALSPGRVVLVRLGKGLGRRVIGKKILYRDPGPAGSLPWQATLEALRETLVEPPWQNTVARVVLSSHWAHYLLVPWQEKLNSDEEEEALVRYRFTEVYGEAAADWEVRWDEGRPPAPSLACAVDRRLLSGLKTLFEASATPLAALQPYLMAAFNRWRRELDGRRDWLLLGEPGRLCLAWFRDEEWAGLHSQQVGENWGQELPRILERTLLLAEPEVVPGRLCIAAPEVPASDLVLAEGWESRRLELPPVPGFEPGRDGAYAMALQA